MNLFLLSLHAAECARWHCDKHVRKMVLELAQLLYTAQHLNRGLQAAAATGGDATESSIIGRLTAKPRAAPPSGGPADLTPLSWEEVLPYAFKPAHYKHPTARWVRTAPANYAYTADLAAALGEEYAHRWGKANACARHVAWLRAHPPPFPDRSAAPIAPAALRRSGPWVATGGGGAGSGDGDGGSGESGGDTSEQAAAATSAVHVTSSSAAAASLGAPASASDAASPAAPAPAADPLAEGEYWAVEGIPPGCTPVPLAMFPQFRQPNAVAAYRAFYQGAKAPFSDYTRRPPPEWLRLHVAGDAGAIADLHPVPATLNQVLLMVDRVHAKASRHAERARGSSGGGGVGGGAGNSSGVVSSGSCSSGGGSEDAGASTTALPVELTVPAGVQATSGAPAKVPPPGLAAALSGLRDAARLMEQSAAQLGGVSEDGAVVAAATAAKLLCEPGDSAAGSASAVAPRKAKPRGAGKKQPAPPQPLPDRRYRFLASRLRVQLLPAPSPATAAAVGSEAAVVASSSAASGRKRKRPDAPAAEPSAVPAGPAAGAAVQPPQPKRRVWLVMSVSEARERELLASYPPAAISSDAAASSS